MFISNPYTNSFIEEDKEEEEEEEAIANNNKKNFSFLPKLNSPTNDLFLDGAKKSKRGDFTGSGPKARLKRALQKLKNNNLRFEENLKKNRVEYDEGASRENGIIFFIRSMTFERGLCRCVGYAKPMKRKQSESEVIGEILDDDDEDAENGAAYRKNKTNNKELNEILDEGEHEATVLFTKDLQRELQLEVGREIEIFQPFYEVFAKDVLGEITRCILRCDFARRI